ncbi:MAG TPA: 16S rRNA (cytosine(1402)-N(4))-methyltransferase RsmH [Phycisphaerae bacterium]|nr:16S rRNA (cytosine(1402)-N(4))-methyltransferase RsmH [Phycisphaerae bacterium]
MTPNARGHLPVLTEQVLRVLQPAGRRLLVDCTIGPGGHAEALLDAAGRDARLIGIDLDETSLALARGNLERFGERVRLFRANFADVCDVLAEAGEERTDLLLADLGVASTQLDDAARGLSFAADGPLDMRMDPQAARTAADLVHRLSETQLADLIYRFGEERYSRRIARAIVVARTQNRIERTSELARIVAGAVPPAARRRRRGVHPATRTFQALRIAVNDELGSLQRMLERLEQVLTPGGRAAVISFHSLEDRPVKQHFARLAAAGAARLLTRKPLTATVADIAANPRSRSAKLRAIERTA